nr:hypothetical protein Itr_chr07CG08690 [Ipomoea trifida]
MPGMGKDDAATSSPGERMPLPSPVVGRACPSPPPLLLCLHGKKNRGRGPMVEERMPPSSYPNHSESNAATTYVAC